MPERETFDLQLPSGRIHAERLGPADGPLTLCVHGLSGNLRSFDAIADRLATADPGRRIVAVDLRGRGRSEVTPPGTYGLDAHVRDVHDIADALGAERLDYVGWSMGALIGMKAVAEVGRIDRLVLLDHAGAVDPEAITLIRAGLARLDVKVPSPETYVGAIRSAGAVTPWSPFWDEVYAYELGDAREDGTYTPLTSRAATTEDLDQATDTAFFARDVWPRIDVPTLLIRCSVPIGDGLIVPANVLAAIRETLPRLTIEEIDRNHYALMDDPRTAGWIVDFLTGSAGQG